MATQHQQERPANSQFAPLVTCQGESVRRMLKNCVDLGLHCERGEVSALRLYRLRRGMTAAR
eukprot:5926765-Pleurochrysis_carterae.AAC.4